jgi:PAS domain S-box-containing protein
MEIIESKSGECALQAVMGKLADPEEFINKVKLLYTARNESSRDELALKDDRTFDLYSAPMHSVEGKHYGRVWYFRDITSTKQAEEMLRESEERYRELFEKESDAIVVFDGETHKFEDANAAALELYGYTRAEFLALTAEDISVKSDQTQATIARIVAGDADFFKAPLLRYHRKKDGTVFPIEISSGVYLVNGRKKVIGAMRDISERKQAEEELKKAYDELENKVKERTKELQERIEELERFRTATVDREFRMKELRDEIERLKSEKSK